MQLGEGKGPNNWLSNGKSDDWLGSGAFGRYGRAERRKLLPFSATACRRGRRRQWWWILRWRWRPQFGPKKHEGDRLLLWCQSTLLALLADGVADNFGQLVRLERQRQLQFVHDARDHLVGCCAFERLDRQSFEFRRQCAHKHLGEETKREY